MAKIGLHGLQKWLQSCIGFLGCKPSTGTPIEGSVMASVVEQMTWVARQERWVKKLTAHNVPPEYRKQHWVSPRQLQETYPDLVQSLTRDGSRQAANQYWHDLQAKIRRTVVAPSLEELVAKKNLTKKEIRLFNEQLWERLAPARQLLSQLDLPPHEQKSPQQWAVLDSVVKGALNKQLPLRQVESESKLSYWRDRWLTLKQSEVKSSSYAPLPVHLDRFEQHVGSDIDVATINEETLESFQLHLAGLVKANEISQTYAKNVCNATVKPFVRYLAKHRKISLPNNLDDVGFASVKKKPVPIPLDIARRLLSESSGRLKAWLLLMFNCAYYQSDLSDLKPSEVDWMDKRITRKRSKEKDEENVPEVCYLLWKESFQGLKEWGSRKGDRVFTDDGKPLIQGRSDVVAREFAKLRKKLGVDEIKLKQIRKTSTNILNGNISYGAYVRYYGGWSPMGVADTNYLVPPHPIMDEMSNYLRQKLLG
jgi:integrase